MVQVELSPPHTPQLSYDPYEESKIKEERKGEEQGDTD